MELPTQLPVWVLDLAIGMTVIEGVVLDARARRVRRAGGTAPLVWPDLAAGMALMFAARTALQGGAPIPMAMCMLAALAAHLVDLRARWRAGGKQPP